MKITVGKTYPLSSIPSGPTTTSTLDATITHIWEEEGQIYVRFLSYDYVPYKVTAEEFKAASLRWFLLEEEARKLKERMSQMKEVEI